MLKFSLLFLLFPPLAFSSVFPMPTAGNDLVGENQQVFVYAGSKLSELVDRYGASAFEIMEANPHLNVKDDTVFSNGSLLIPGQHILPMTRKGIVINLSELRLYYFTPDGKEVMTFPVGLGRRNWRTPLGQTWVVKKVENPTWHVPHSVKINTLKKFGQVLPDEVPPGENNPLGRFAIFLQKRGIVIHGTNHQWTVGYFTSSGCIRLLNADIKELFTKIKKNTPVLIINQPMKIGWLNNQLYFSSHVPLHLHQQQSASPYQLAQTMVKKRVRNQAITIDQTKLKHAILESRGFPVSIGKRQAKPLKKVDKKTGSVHLS